MSDPRHFSDEELTAYLDGEREHAPVRDIEERLATDPQLRARLEALRVDTGRLVEAFNTLMPAAPDAPAFLDPDFDADSNRRNPMRAAGLAVAAALVAGVIGFAGGSYWYQEPEAGWIDVVADYQTLYVPETFADLQRPPGEVERELEAVASSFGKPLPMSTVTAHARLNLKRAQLLGFKGKPLVQLAFQSAGGDPVALCIIKTAKPGEAAVSVASLKGMQTARWRRDGYAYVLIGGDDAELIRNAAEAFSRSL